VVTIAKSKAVTEINPGGGFFPSTGPMRGEGAGQLDKCDSDQAREQQQKAGRN
jgi:hypothetical protein